MKRTVASRAIGRVDKVDRPARRHDRLFGQGGLDGRRCGRKNRPFRQRCAPSPKQGWSAPAFGFCPRRGAQDHGNKRNLLSLVLRGEDVPLGRHGSPRRRPLRRRRSVAGRARRDYNLRADAKERANAFLRAISRWFRPALPRISSTRSPPKKPRRCDRESAGPTSRAGTAAAEGARIATGRRRNGSQSRGSAPRGERRRSRGQRLRRTETSAPNAAAARRRSSPVTRQAVNVASLAAAAESRVTSRCRPTASVGCMTQRHGSWNQASQRSLTRSPLRRDRSTPRSPASIRSTPSS